MSEIQGKKAKRRPQPVGRTQIQADMEGNLASNQRGLTNMPQDMRAPNVLEQMTAAATLSNAPVQPMRTPIADMMLVKEPGEGDNLPGSAPMGSTELDSAPGTGMTMYKPVGSRITKEMLFDATRTMHKYKAGKSSVERRVIDAQQWWKLRNWEKINQQGIKGSSSTKSATAWLWNCVVGKHADAMDAYPEPAILPRVEDDKAEAAMLTDIIPVVMKLNNFEETYSDVTWQKMQEGTGAYGVYWDKSKLNGLGDISIKKINILNLYWEPGISNIQDSKNVFHVAMMDNDTLKQMYPQLRGQTLSSAETVSKYIYDDSVDTTDKSLVIDWYYHQYFGPRKVLHYVKYVGEHVLYATVDDPACAERGLYDDGDYPFVLDPLYPVEGSPCGFGYIYVGKGTQKDIDLLSQAVVSNAAINATPAARF